MPRDKRQIPKPHIYLAPDVEGPIAMVPGGWVCSIWVGQFFAHIEGVTPRAAYLKAVEYAAR